MDTETAQRLQQLEAKVDKVIAFTDRLETLFTAWMGGGRGRLLSAAAKLHRPGGGDAR